MNRRIKTCTAGSGKRSRNIRRRWKLSNDTCNGSYWSARKTANAGVPEKERIEMALATLSPAWFAREYLGFEPDEAQTMVLEQSIHYRRIALNCNRQWGKSTIAAILAVHRLLTRDGAMVLIVGPSGRQSGETLRKVLGFLGVLMNVVSGMLMMLADSYRYVVTDITFAPKIAFIVIGATAVLYFSVSDRLWNLKAGEDAPMAAKWVAAVVLLAWAGVIVCGRLLPYL